MSVKAFGPDGKEIDLTRSKKSPRNQYPFEKGFHAAVIDKAINENPYPPYTNEEIEWTDGWNTYKERKKRLRWIDPKINAPGATDDKSGITFLCLVLDEDGFYLHMPCKTKGLLLSGAVIWEDYNNRAGIKVIEYAHVVMSNPHLVDAMQAKSNWTAVDGKSTSNK